MQIMETHQLKGANMDIDLTTDASDIKWKQDQCPWNSFEGTKKHRCAVKNISLCRYFEGVVSPDGIMCAYPKD